MKISEKSWHYRLIKASNAYRRVPGNLCAYMRSLLWAILLVTVGVTAGCFIAFSAVIAPLVLFGWLEVARPSFLHFSSIIGAAAYTIAVFGTGLYFFMNWWEDRRDRQFGQPPKQPGLVRSWVAAKKSKICPLLQFEE